MMENKQDRRSGMEVVGDMALLACITFLDQLMVSF
jgi:hypothetical protein